MPKLPRNVAQDQAVRALVRLGGVEVLGGKGSHRKVDMPNGHTVVLPHGSLKVGLLAKQLRESGLAVQEFIDAL